MEIIELTSPLTPWQTADILALMPELDATITFTPEMLQAAVADPATHQFAVVEDGHIIGTASLCVSHSPTGRKGGIEDVVVSSAFRGRHLGRLLMEHIIGYARRELAPIELHLTSRPFRESANRLYRAVGFRPYETNVYKLPID
ncbi:MAG: GNAT family N-acetyltransferase [Bacteroidales bacterium]|nr:GNAT family N-acetyltransferase [Bacteroidales bacterium]